MLAELADTVALVVDTPMPVAGRLGQGRLRHSSAHCSGKLDWAAFAGSWVAVVPLADSLGRPLADQLTGTLARGPTVGRPVRGILTVVGRPGYEEVVELELEKVDSWGMVVEH